MNPYIDGKIMYMYKCPMLISFPKLLLQKKANIIEQHVYFRGCKIFFALFMKLSIGFA